MQQTISVEILDNPDAVLVPGEPLERLAQQAGDHGLFYRGGWLRSHWPALERYGGPLFLLARKGSRPVGLAPLQLERKAVTKGGLRRLHVLGNAPGAMDNMAPDLLLADPAERDGVLAAFGDCLLGSLSRRWDLLELRYVRPESPLADLARLLGAEPEGQEQMETPLIDVAGSFDDYLAGRSKNLRKMVRRRRKQLAARPGGHRYLSGPTLEPALLERVARLHSQRQARLRQQGRERISLFDDPVQARGFGELLTWAAAEGATWHHWLEVDGKLAGALLSFRQGRTLFPYLIAIDEEFGELSPSLLLHMQLVEQAHEQGQIRLIDQLPGENQLKRQISTRMRPHHRYSIPNSARTGAQVRLGYYRLAKDLLGRFRS